MPSITPSLWFDHNFEEAARFYTSVFPNSRIEDLNRSTDAGPGEPGSILSGTFVLDGTRFIGINGGPQFSFSEAVSFTIDCTIATCGVPSTSRHETSRPPRSLVPAAER